MTRSGEISRSPVETRGDFKTHSNPSLFIDNWGVDVIAKYSAKVQKPIDRMVLLAQLMSSIRSGQGVKQSALEIEPINDTIFVDGSDGKTDHFFSVDLDSLYIGGSYDGPRVAADFNTGYVELEPDEEGKSLFHYDTRWSSRRGDIIAGRNSQLFEQDTERLNHAITVLGGVSLEDISHERPSTWPGEPEQPEASLNTLSGLSLGQTVIYLGETPLENVAPELDRRIHIPTLDGPLR